MRNIQEPVVEPCDESIRHIWDSCIWHKNHIRPSLYVGDKIVGIVCERYARETKSKLISNKKHSFVIVLTATEDGFSCDNEVFDGYGYSDCTVWAYERDFAKIVDSLIPNFDWN